MNSSLRFKRLIAPLLLGFAAFQAAQAIAATPARMDVVARQPTPEQATATGWQEIISSTGDFSVFMPGEPEEVTNSSPAGTPLYDLRIFLVRQAEQPESQTNTVYTFSYGTEVSLPAQPSPEQIDQYFNRLRTFLLGGEGARLLNDQSLSIDGNPGREIEVGLADLSGAIAYVTRMRIYLVGQRVYLLQAIATSEEAVHSSEAEQFLNSFQRRSARP